jgi:hypothetical protein
MKNEIGSIGRGEGGWRVVRGNIAGKKLWGPWDNQEATIRSELGKRYWHGRNGRWPTVFSYLSVTMMAIRT